MPRSTPSATRSAISAPKKLAFSAVFIVLFFGGVELFLKVSLPVIAAETLPNKEMKHQFDAQTFRYDPDLYWYWMKLPHSEYDLGGFRGERGHSTPLEKTPGVTRIVTFGDSQTQGAGLDWDQAWPETMDQALGDSVEVLNAAVPGYRSLNIYRLLRKKIIHYKPDIIVIDCMPFDSPRDDTPLRGDSQGAHSLKSMLWESWTYYTLRRVLEKLQPAKYRWLDSKNGPRLGMYDGEGNHDLILRWAEAQGIKTVFTEYPISEDGNRKAIMCMTLPGELPEGAIIAPVCDALKKSGLSIDELFQDTNHLTAPGAKIMGEAIAKTIQEQLLN